MHDTTLLISFVSLRNPPAKTVATVARNLSPNKHQYCYVDY